ncbi:MAG: hypothetical protein SFW62_02415 [Alphaproteobacteria bacterium]|nr:hypothetical protein [Alphaproteobacteria bacterium]
MQPAWPFLGLPTCVVVPEKSLDAYYEHLAKTQPANAAAYLESMASFSAASLAYADSIAEVLPADFSIYSFSGVPPLHARVQVPGEEATGFQNIFGLFMARGEGDEPVPMAFVDDYKKMANGEPSRILKLDELEVYDQTESQWKPARPFGRIKTPLPALPG